MPSVVANHSSYNDFHRIDAARVVVAERRGTGKLLGLSDADCGVMV